MGALDGLLNEMSGDFESSNFENADEKMVPASAQAAPTTRQRGGAIQHYGQVGSTDTITGLIVASKGDLNITVKRVGVNIVDTPLPYILFGLQGLSTNFFSALKPYLPAGVSVKSVSTADGNLTIEYQKTGVELTDKIIVSLSGLISYGEFLQAMNQNYFKAKYIRYEVAEDSYRLSQQSEQIQFGLLSALGAQSANQLMPRSRQMSWDFNKGITNILMPEQKITADFSFIQNIVAVNEYKIAWDVFMSERVNLNKV